MSTAKNGRGAAMIAWIAAHPGRTGKEVCEAAGVTIKNGLLSYLVARGKVFASGPTHWQRYYPTAEEAQANHEALCREAREHVRRKQAETHRLGTIRKRARRHAQGVKPVNCRTADICDIKLPDGVVLSPTVRILIAPAPRDRFTPDPGFVRVISLDWLQARNQSAGREAA